MHTSVLLVISNYNLHHLCREENNSKYMQKI